MQLQSLLDKLNLLAPFAWQEDYDNSGLLVGNGDQTVNKALVVLDVTEETVEEAYEKQCDVIIAHHPLIFQSLNQLTGRSEVERSVAKAIQKGIAIVAMHTNLDNAPQGVNARISERIGLTNSQILRPKTGLLKKMVTYCPNMKSESGAYYPGIIRQELFKAGAGDNGSYDLASYNTEGKGTFRATGEYQPFVGSTERMHVQDEIRIETVFPQDLTDQVVKALKSVHPYEQIPFDIYPLESPYKQAGSGMIGRLEKAMSPDEFLSHLKEVMKVHCIRYTAGKAESIQTVAVCGGAGRFLLSDAMKAGADAFITADFKYHDFFDAKDSILLADIGHYESEQFTIDLLYEWLEDKIPNFEVSKTEVNTNPINYL